MTPKGAQNGAKLASRRLRESLLEASWGLLGPLAPQAPKKMPNIGPKTAQVAPKSPPRDVFAVFLKFNDF